MPILVTSSITPEEKQAIIDDAITQILATPTGYVDATGAEVSVRQALHRGAWMYDQRARISGLEAADRMDDTDDQAVADRVTQVESALVANTTADAAEAAEQDQIRTALQQPILP